LAFPLDLFLKGKQEQVRTWKGQKIKASTTKKSRAYRSEGIVSTGTLLFGVAADFPRLRLTGAFPFTETLQKRKECP